jgi:atypical dual specificity phosphatase
MNRSLTLDEDYFERRSLRLLCTQRFPWADVDFTPEASLIIPDSQGLGAALYLCDMYTATSATVLERLGITHIISVVNAPGFVYPARAGMKHMCIPLDDTYNANIGSYFDVSTAWIHSALSDGEARVMVHCMWGMSRSASIVIAYLMAMKGMSLQSALMFVKARRRIVRPNRGFMAQLNIFEHRLSVRELRKARLAGRDRH